MKVVPEMSTYCKGESCHDFVAYFELSNSLSNLGNLSGHITNCKKKILYNKIYVLIY